MKPLSSRSGASIRSSLGKSTARKSAADSSMTASRRSSGGLAGGVDAQVPPDVQNRAFRKLIILKAAEELEDLRQPPSNRLEKLKGDRVEQYSIRVNAQWRICMFGRVERMTSNWRTTTRCMAGVAAFLVAERVRLHNRGASPRSPTTAAAGLARALPQSSELRLELANPSSVSADAHGECTSYTLCAATVSLRLRNSLEPSCVVAAPISIGHLLAIS